MSEYDITSILEYESNDPTPIAPEIETVPATDPIGETLELMSKNNYSQLGVKKNGSLTGIVSYRSVVETQLVISDMNNYRGEWFNIKTGTATTEVKKLPQSADILELFDHLTHNPYAVIEGDESYHIVTDYDLLTFITESLRPFLQIEQVENSLREVIRFVYENSDNRIKEISGEEEDKLRQADGVSDCGFIHYERTISENWEEGFADIFRESKSFTINLIKYIREERNNIVHFTSSDRAQRRLLELDLAVRYLEEARQRLE